MKTTSLENEKRIINLIIVDESGSMSSIYHEALDGMNHTISTIREAAAELDSANQYVTLITFDSNHYNMIFRHRPALCTRRLSMQDYRPGGCTPLYDAIGISLTRLEPHITPNDAVLVTIITDGEENASRQYNCNDIYKLISRLKEQGWLFTFIGANQDVIGNARSMGIDKAMEFEATSDGANMMWEKERKARKNYYKRVKTFMNDSPNCCMSNFNMQECSSEEDFFNREE